MALYRRKDCTTYWYDFMIAGVRYRGSTKQKTSTKAHRVEAMLMAKAEAGHFPSVSRRPMMLRELAESHFLPFISQNNRLSVKTKECYEYGWQLLKEQAIAGIRVDQIHTEDVEMIQIKGSPSTVNCGLRTLRRMLNLAVAWEWLQRVPRIHLLEENQRSLLIEAGTEAELQVLLRGAIVIGILLILDAGLRPNEVAELKVEQISFARGTIHVLRGKTSNAARYLPMSDRVREALMTQLGNRTEGWVFPSPRYPDRHITRNALTQAFARARSMGAFPKELKLYCARHTFATDIMAETGNVFLLQKLMGHNDVRTLGRYQHPSIAHIGAIVNKRNESRHGLRYGAVVGA
ncbi:MAG: tyrosine-type recombinase/integrase [Acidobacteriaceae bacterium]